jgi:hypothetical protein
MTTAKERLYGLFDLIYTQQQPSLFPNITWQAKRRAMLLSSDAATARTTTMRMVGIDLERIRGQPSDHLIAAARDARLFGSVGRASLCDINDDDTVYFRLDCCDRMKFTSSFYPLSNFGQDDTDWHVFVCVRPCGPLFPDNVVEMNLWNHNLEGTDFDYVNGHATDRKILSNLFGPSADHHYRERRPLIFPSLVEYLEAYLWCPSRRDDRRHQRNLPYALRDILQRPCDLDAVGPSATSSST